MAHIDLSQPPQIYSLNRATHGTLDVERYQFDDIWCLHLYNNAFELRLDDETHAIRPGMLTLIPPGVAMHYIFKEQHYNHYYCLFRANDQLGQAFDSYVFEFDTDTLHCIRHLFRSAIQGQHLSSNRSQNAIHEILWQIISSGDVGRLNPVTQARHMIASMLNHDISVSKIASNIGISGNQLTRLFNQELGMTVIAYIRQQRMNLAKRLIQETDLPIKRIAQECGMYDLQYFNKTVRQFFDCSPRQLRES